MRRIYGYKKRHACNGHRYQDGFNAQAKKDKIPEINDKAFSTVAVLPDQEEIIDVQARATSTAAVPPMTTLEKPAVVSITDDSDETGGLPKHMTGFMPHIQGADPTADTAPQTVVESADTEQDTE